MTPNETPFIGFSILTLTHKAASGLSQPSVNYPFLCTQYLQPCVVKCLINTSNKYEVLADTGKCKQVHSHAQVIRYRGSHTGRDTQHFDVWSHPCLYQTCRKDHMVRHSFQMEKAKKEGAGQHWVRGHTHSWGPWGPCDSRAASPSDTTSVTPKSIPVSNFQLVIILSQLSFKLITLTRSYPFIHLSVTFRRLFKMIIYCRISGTFAHFDVLSIWSFYPIPSAHSLAHSGQDAKRWNSHFSSVNALWSCGETAHRHQSFRQLLGSSASLWLLSFCCFWNQKQKYPSCVSCCFFNVLSLLCVSTSSSCISDLLACR